MPDTATGDDGAIAVTAPATFYYDLCSPYSWLVAERLVAVAPDAVWCPLATVDLSVPVELWDGDRERVERLAREFGLPRPRWRGDSVLATDPEGRRAALVANFAKSIGRTVAFSLAAMRQAFNGGRDLDDIDTLLIAAAACETHPRAVLKALETEGPRAAAAAAVESAADAGVTALPALVTSVETIGPDRIISLLATDVVAFHR